VFRVDLITSVEATHLARWTCCGEADLSLKLFITMPVHDEGNSLAVIAKHDVGRQYPCLSTCEMDRSRFGWEYCWCKLVIVRTPTIRNRQTCEILRLTDLSRLAQLYYQLYQLRHRSLPITHAPASPTGGSWLITQGVRTLRQYTVSYQTVESTKKARQYLVRGSKNFLGRIVSVPAGPVGV
jgi:hypothetical protein